jgi:hypothetical protein
LSVCAAHPLTRRRTALRRSWRRRSIGQARRASLVHAVGEPWEISLRNGYPRPTRAAPLAPMQLLSPRARTCTLRYPPPDTRYILVNGDFGFRVCLPQPPQLQ